MLTDARTDADADGAFLSFLRRSAAECFHKAMREGEEKRRRERLRVSRNPGYRSIDGVGRTWRSFPAWPPHRPRPPPPPAPLLSLAFFGARMRAGGIRTSRCTATRRLRRRRCNGSCGRSPIKAAETNRRSRSRSPLVATLRARSAADAVAAAVALRGQSRVREQSRAPSGVGRTRTWFWAAS